MADEYVCFFDDPTNDSFFIFDQSKYLRKYMIANGIFGKLPIARQKELQKGFLIVRGYAKGVPFSEQQLFYKDGESWVTENFIVKRTPMRMRFSINWQTLRYRRAVEILNTDSSYQKEEAVYGRCETVSAGVPQHGFNPKE